MDYKIDISKNQVRKLLDNEIEILEFLVSILTQSDEDGGVHRRICDTLASYHGYHGSPSVEDFELEDAVFNRNLKKGEATVTYDVDLYFGCADLNRSDDDYQRVGFQINTEDWTLSLSFPERPERDTVDEF